jgi:hypothetical protein
MQDTFEEIFHAMGAQVMGNKPGAESQYGWPLQEELSMKWVLARMGNDPKTSVLNKYSQAHECNNLFVVDAGRLCPRRIKTLHGPLWHFRSGHQNILWIS